MACESPSIVVSDPLDLPVTWPKSSHTAPVNDAKIYIVAGTLEFNRHPPPSTFSAKYKPGTPVTDHLRGECAFRPTPSGRATRHARSSGGDVTQPTPRWLFDGRAVRNLSFARPGIGRRAIRQGRSGVDSSRDRLPAGREGRPLRRLTTGGDDGDYGSLDRPALYALDRGLRSGSFFKGLVELHPRRPRPLAYSL
jgi:hypothetical protein